MLGAIIGDIVGSRFEFSNRKIDKNIKFFTQKCNFTDDTVMTIAVAEALEKAGKDASEREIKAELVKSMQTWGRKYPNAGYGGMFYHWVFSDHPRPYNSFGNGSAMRVSSVGWMYDTLERTREIARYTAEVTHNHPEGVKGAECTAAVIYMGRSGATKDEIKAYVEKEFGYDLSHTLEELAAYHDETCMDSLPKALTAFFEGEDFQDVVRNAVSLGGDTDTLAAIAGAMAEGSYFIPTSMMERVLDFLDDDIQKNMISFFDKEVGPKAADRLLYTLYV